MTGEAKHSKTIPYQACALSLSWCGLETKAFNPRRLSCTGFTILYVCTNNCACPESQDNSDHQSHVQRALACHKSLLSEAWFWKEWAAPGSIESSTTQQELYIMLYYDIMFLFSLSWQTPGEIPSYRIPETFKRPKSSFEWEWQTGMCAGGAKWDLNGGCLADADTMALFNPMPIAPILPE